jgi:hypothetical protein
MTIKEQANRIAAALKGAQELHLKKKFCRVGLATSLEEPLHTIDIPWALIRKSSPAQLVAHIEKEMKK